jgi:hypothetical protein
MKKISVIIFCYVLFVFNSNIYAQTNYALDFDGGDDYISAGYLHLANNSFTIEFWAKQDAAALGRYRIAVSQGTGVSNQGLHIGFRDNNHFTFAFYGDDLDYTTAFTNTDWHHWACTYDASTNTRKIYLDGKLVASDNPASDYSGGDKLYIGYNVVSGNNYWDGQIDEVRVWGEERKHADVLSTMHIQLSGSESNLLANWRLDDGTGFTADDLKNSYDGTLQNMAEEDWINSSVPFGSGTNETQTGFSTGSWITFSGTGARMYFNTLPAGEIVSVTKISGAPNVVPTDLDDVFDSQYWIINRSSADAIDANIEFSIAEDLTSEDNSNRHWIRLYDRAFNSDGAWSYLKDAAWVDATNNYAAFDNISTFQQFIYGRLYDLFTENSSSLTGVDYSDADWGDYDNDGDLDILLTGYDGSNWAIIYKNNGDQTFSNSGIGLWGVAQGSSDWGDYNNDGDLDVLITGSGVSKIFKNNGSDSFSDISAGLTGISFSSAAWGDYDNDGDLDILLTGYDGSNKISKIYRNNGSDSFTDIGAGLTGVQNGSVAWGDYDNDGDLDILLIGYDGSSYISKIYQNNGNDSFSDINAGLTEVGWGSAAWGDYDNDGDLDILLTGYTGSVRISKIYKNNGNESFTDINAGLTGVAGPAAWGDYNSDGNLDVLLSGAGYDGSSLRISRIYKNNGNDSFTDINAGLTSVTAGCSAWGDYDNDGDLDILLTGETGSEKISKIYRNNSTVSNSVPNTPTNLSSSISGDEVTLSWDAGNR